MMDWFKITKKLPEPGKVAVCVEPFLSDVGIDIFVSNTDYIIAHPDRCSDWAYVEYPADFAARKFERLKDEYGEEEAKIITERNVVP